MRAYRLKWKTKPFQPVSFSADECNSTRLSFYNLFDNFLLSLLAVPFPFISDVHSHKNASAFVDKAGFCPFPFAFILTPLSGRIETTIQIRLHPSFVGTFSSSPPRSVSLANSISSIAASFKIAPILSSFQRFSQSPAGTGNSYVCGRISLLHT